MRRSRSAPDKTALVVITGMLALSWSLMASQAMELVTRAFYSRADLDLILSSPAAARHAVRGAHRHDDAGDGADVALAGVALHQCAGGARRRALARRLPGGGRDQFHRHGVRGGGHHRAVHDAWTETDAPRRAGHGRGHRRRLRHRAAARGDPIARHPVADRASLLLRLGRAGPGERQHSLLAGTGRGRRPHRARRRFRRQRAAARHGDRAVRAALRRLRPCRRQRCEGCDANSSSTSNGFRQATPRRALAAEGMAAAQARSVAGVAER